ncbi:hypothetical protein HYN48_13575 [Flavobacterium magnum]|uniref:Carboxypeptidase regulatory-like domain-containing protein n=1 Tax=Flavobacterium magnum TaxID=2162713 RepID=A0A2S0RII1_9FLAO|nr:hypothetical protein [Flavobacterium magnum]AWA31028.1 hypothetical protein HYN48_13575 [Flavobacterium magnum]
MKKLLTYFILSIAINAYSQNSKISGYITLTDSNSDYKYLTVLLVSNDSIVTGAVPDENGHFEFVKKVIAGNYDLKIREIGVCDLEIKDISVINGEDKNLKISYPGECKYIKVKKPMCVYNHYDNIIPIVYGFPNKKMMKKAEQEKLFLGGCKICGCDPNYYCKTHKLEF